MAGQAFGSNPDMASSVAAVIVAAGRGTRAGGGLPKQYRALAGEPVIRSSLSLFCLAWRGRRRAGGHPSRRSWPRIEAAAKGLKLMPPVFGGATRQASVRAGLEALSAGAPDIVLVHDAARPFCSSGAGVARDRRLRADRRGDPGARSDRHDQARRCRGRDHRHARPRGVAQRADAAGVRLPRAARRAPQGRRRRARRFHRRRGAGGMGRPQGRRPSPAKRATPS